MTIFVSYSHDDSEFVDRLVNDLIGENVKIWVDKWEINVGDSIIDKIQNAIEGASALLVVLSNKSIESSWCKKELNTAIIRELDENHVLVLPVLKEECKIPLFLRDKKYANFTKNYDIGLKDILKAVSSISSDTLGRDVKNDLTIDWAINYGEDISQNFSLELYLTEQKSSEPFSVITTIVVKGNDKLTKSYNLYRSHKLDWFYRPILLKMVSEILIQKKIKVHLSEALPAKMGFTFRDRNSSLEFYVDITSRRLGTDTGNDILLNVSGQIDAVLHSLLKTLRPLTKEEEIALRDIQSTSL